MKKLCLAFLVLAVLLAACAPAPAAATLTPTASQPTDTPEPTAEPTPSVPESISRYESILRQLGLTVTVVGQEVQLVNKDNEPVLVSAEAAAITIQTEDGETLTFPEEALEVEQTIARGLENVLTIQDSQGNVQYFYLEKTGLWATPIEQFTNPRDIENYPTIKLEDVWSGRTVISTALVAEQFPEGTLVPDEFAYMLWHPGGGVRIQDFLNGELDTQIAYRAQLKYDNDYRRYVAFYQSETLEGVAVILGTEQVLTPDGKTSVFFHYVFGDEWNWVEGTRSPSGRQYNVVDSIFRAREPSFDPNMYLRTARRPLVSLPQNQDGSVAMGGWGNIVGATEAVGLRLYINEPRNNPLSLRPDLQDLIDERTANPLGRIDYLASVGQEIAGLQYMLLTGASIGIAVPVQ